jgi:hypothetical protein
MKSRVTFPIHPWSDEAIRGCFEGAGFVDVKRFKFEGVPVVIYSGEKISAREEQEL